MASKIKTFIFDIDGTLIDTYKASVTAFRNALFDVLGVKYTEDELNFHFGITIEDALSRLNVDPKYNKKISDRIDEIYYQHSKNKAIFRGIDKMLEMLSKEEVIIGIVTSKRREEYKLDFEILPIAKYFKVAICSDDTLKHKPHPDPIEKFIEITGAKKEETIYIGDTAYDSDSAHAAGIKFGLATWGALDIKVQNDYLFNEPKDILKLI